jgi:predicted ATPase/DNA-binding SARP family transcriptional activator
MAKSLQSQQGLLSSNPTTKSPETASLVLGLFGSFDARIDGVPLPRLRSRRGQWLLAILALRAGRSVERSWLAGTLWPDSTEENALVSLRQTLTDLRRALGTERERLASPTARTLCFHADGAFVDVSAFDSALKIGDSASLAQAVRLHHRPLLDDCHEEWVFAEREHREQACLTARMTLGNEALAAGRLEEAVVFLRGVVSADPFREDACRALMSALTQSGNPGEAVWVYRDLRLRLQSELRTEPAAETRALYERIRSDSRQPHETRENDKRKDEHTQPFHSIVPPAGQLPKPLTDLIGREQDTLEVSSRLFRSRLVSLVGIGGVGKTRLAIQVAGVWAEDQPEGVAFVDLAPISDGGQTARAVAGVLGVAEESSRSLSETLSEALRERRFLLVLDNCEHLLDACAQLAAHLLAECPALVILTTSRQALGVTGESVWPVSPLAVPTAAERISAETVSRSPAVRLFVDRASAALPGFSCNDQNYSSVSEICSRLDGVPLALELAAVRIRVLGPRQIAARLNDRFGLLNRGSRSVLPRQQTLRALIDWSYDLLSESERRLLGRCSVFAGGWTLEAAEAVCAETLEETDVVLDTLSGLVHQSLVQVTSDEGSERRYRLLETVRQYARERLGHGDEADQTLRRHRDWFLELTKAAQVTFREIEQVVWLNRLESEHDNLRAAIEYCRQDEEGALPQLKFAGGLWRFWLERGYFSEGRAYLTAAMVRSEGIEAEDSLRTKVLNGAAAMAWHQGDISEARAWCEEGLRRARRSGDPVQIDPCLNNLGAVVYSQGDLVAAKSLWEEALALRRISQDAASIASTLNNLAYLASSEGDSARAEQLHGEALSLVRDEAHRHQRRAALIGLGNLCDAAGEYENAAIYFEEALSLSRDLDDKECICGSLTALGKLAIQQGQMARAGVLLQEALVLARDTGMKPVMIEGLEVLAKLFLECGRPQWAGRIWGAVETQRRLLGLPMHRNDLLPVEKMIAAICTELGPEASEVAWSEGSRMRLEVTLAWALERLNER